MLQLNNVQRNQTGLYTCTTANVVGTASANITLTVQCEWKGREGSGTDGGEGKVECEKGKGGERKIVIGGSQNLGAHYSVSKVCVCVHVCVV